MAYAPVTFTILNIALLCWKIFLVALWVNAAMALVVNSSGETVENNVRFLPGSLRNTYWLHFFEYKHYVSLLKITSIPWAVRLIWLENAYSRQFFRWAVLTHNVRHTDLLLLLLQMSRFKWCHHNRCRSTLQNLPVKCFMTFVSMTVYYQSAGNSARFLSPKWLTENGT